MYVPKQFKETRMAVLAQAIRDVQLATLVTAGMDGYRASHIPMIFKQVSGEMFLEGHVARGNDHSTGLNQSGVVSGGGSHAGA